ncbi:aquaporin NIP1-4-like [Oryza brachyantha]|uniref:aquaporin NIP1-4-like n=1 Tax=Oryza brachyantha TaxID=4533 RepID=UPI001AD9BDD7|nr:aquaporin NIP1-4-like [Oryza brachyantha]
MAGRRREDDSYTNGSVSVVEVVSMEEGRNKDKEQVQDDHHLQADDDDDGDVVVCGVPVEVTFLQMLLAEFLGTYFLMFAGLGAITVEQKKGAVTLPGVAVVWGTVVMAMVYAVGHISGAHLNPAVTVGFAVAGRFPWRQTPAYVLAQTVAATAASLALRLMFGGRHAPVPATLPAGTDVQSLAVEFVITFYLMFVIMAVATDDRAVGHMAGVAVGGTIMLNVLFAGPVSGASMNPARSVGPALVGSKYTALWVYILGPFAGAAAGARAYNFVRLTGDSEGEVTKGGAGRTA